MLERKNNIDFFRAVAILMVFIVHFKQIVISFSNEFLNIFNFGMFGVPLFFIISGWSVSYIFFNTKISIKNFLVRRFVRIYPLYIFISLLCFFIYGDSGYSEYWSPNNIDLFQIIKHFLLLNFLSPVEINAILPGAWSIVNELIFYILFILLIIKYFHKLKIIHIFIAILFSIIIQNLIILYHDYLFDNVTNSLIHDFVYLNFITHFPAFLLGVFLYKNNSHFSSDCYNIFIFFLILLVLKFYIPTLYITLYFFIFLFYLFIKKSFCFSFNSFFINKLGNCFGRYSYGIYLCHYHVLLGYTFFFGKTESLSFTLLLFIFLLSISTLLGILLEDVIHKFIKRIIYYEKQNI
jgi:exopolysaccharide production protein ExoZ